MVVQQELFTPTDRLTPRAFATYLADGHDRTIDVVATKNRVSMITIDFTEPGPIRVRLHEKFLEAPETIRATMKRYLRSRRRADWKVICDYAEEIPTGDVDRGTALNLETKGNVFDLDDILSKVNRTYFSGRVKCGITWGQMGKRRRGRRRCMNYGSYSDHDNVVTVHPLLDNKRVPREFLEYVVYHEMLHAVVPSERRNGRWIHHTAQFRALEKAYPNFDRMQRIADTLYKKL